MSGTGLGDQQPDALHASLLRIGLYRGHILDPIRFRERIRDSVQVLGFQRSVDDLVRYEPLRDDIASSAFWYQSKPPHPVWVGPDLCDADVGSARSDMSPRRSPTTPEATGKWRLLGRYFLFVRGASDVGPTSLEF